MEVRAVAKFVRVKPLMVRQVAREVRGKSAIEMVNVLQFQPGKGAFHLRKVLVSAIANAENNHDMDASSLRICEIKVDEGPKLKRMQARAMGRGNRILKRTAHITVVVADDAVDTTKPTRGKNAKPRPSLAKAAGRRRVAAAPLTRSVEVVDEAPATAIEEVKQEEAIINEVKTNEEGAN